MHALFLAMCFQTAATIKLPNVANLMLADRLNRIAATGNPKGPRLNTIEYFELRIQQTQDSLKSQDLAIDRACAKGLDQHARKLIERRQITAMYLDHYIAELEKRKDN